MKVKRKGNNGNNRINAGKMNKISEYYYAEDKLIAMNHFKKPKVSGGWWPKHPNKGLNFYHQDALGSVTMTTGRNGQAVERYEYDAYGDPYNGWFEHSAHNQNPYGFTAQRYSNQLGTWNFAYRHYNSNSMRWITKDPVKDGTNWYQYCYSDPVNYIDPDGRNATGAFGTMWTVALAEPTPVGETIASVVTVGYGVYLIANNSQNKTIQNISRQKDNEVALDEVLPDNDALTSLDKNFGRKLKKFFNNGNGGGNGPNWSKIIIGTGVTVGTISYAVNEFTTPQREAKKAAKKHLAMSSKEEMKKLKKHIRKNKQEDIKGEGESDI
ncbi:RHS repeat-associated core domain protein [Halobacteroides halobius DSM 5150]|uniref:RHS repeat-associated core domain protein n=1 Tax=Halobacteroides halobius (strain ATCC 35273 / DSM 5150 / MD-1) TaxID=748449 RepID=L0K863_HALHC|nr:RHS repeat-associated core domain-containing protein [Halobacteroides halobius]AGB41472.1 RHS repeat-associated core domain protein [Halobacteroides halobius DSM 5150]